MCAYVMVVSVAYFYDTRSCSCLVLVGTNSCTQTQNLLLIFLKSDTIKKRQRRKKWVPEFPVLPSPPSSLRSPLVIPKRQPCSQVRFSYMSKADSDKKERDDIAEYHRQIYDQCRKEKAEEYEIAKKYVVGALN